MALNVDSPVQFDLPAAPSVLVSLTGLLAIVGVYCACAAGLRLSGRPA